MGKIKSKAIKRAANALMEKDIKFSEGFDNNKKILSNTMPSKKLRNQLAGFLCRLKRQDNKKQAELKQ